MRSSAKQCERGERTMREFRAGMATLALAFLVSPAHADVAGRYETTDEDAFVGMEMTLKRMTPATFACKWPVSPATIY